MAGEGDPLRVLEPTVLLAITALLLPPPARAWGDEGHAIVALIALQYLDAPARSRAEALLQGDHTDLVAGTDFAAEASWADRYRDSDRDGSQLHYRGTRAWHYIDLERGDPDLPAACFGFPPLPPGLPASAGPADDCIVDKIAQFDAELAAPATAPPERLLALQFLLHFVGDVHQPLHAIDDHDAGGNAERVRARGWRAGSLHQYWDVEFVEQLGTDPALVAARLRARISAHDLQQWRRGTPADWAREAYGLAMQYGYGDLPHPEHRRHYRLPAGYVDDATRTVALQLSRAGVRLAWMLNRALD